MLIDLLFNRDIMVRRISSNRAIAGIYYTHLGEFWYNIILECGVLSESGVLPWMASPYPRFRGERKDGEGRLRWKWIQVIFWSH